MKTSKYVIPNFTASTKPSALISKAVKPPNKKSYKSLRIRKLALAVAFSLSVTVPNISQAATYIVTNTNDVGLGSLRRAIQNANSQTPNEADTIEFSLASGTVINLLSELVVTDSVTIKGPTAGDASSFVLDGGGNNRHINAGGFPEDSGQKLILQNITLRNGFFDGTNLGQGYGGGAIFIKNADIELQDTIISGNSTLGDNAGGGGLYINRGDMTLTQSTISGNSTSGTNAFGGGIKFFEGSIGGLSTTIILTEAVIENNSTTGSNGKGGGAFFRGGQTNISITRSTVSGNSTEGTNAEGGGLNICTGYSNLTLTQSTISGNSVLGSSANGGGIYTHCGFRVLVRQSTITNNNSVFGAGGLQSNNSNTSLILVNSILSGNTGPEDNLDHAGSNNTKAIGSLFGDLASEITDPTSSGNYYSNFPDLGRLQHNGGTTQTHKPKDSSPVINTGITAEATGLNDDQRGSAFPRVIDNIIDIGALELQNVSGNLITPLNINEVITRRDMARQILKELEGDNYIPLDPNNNDEPYQVTGIFEDVGVGDVNAVFIEELHRRGLTEGCTTNKFCPDMVVTKELMAKMFFKTWFPNFDPPATQINHFDDVPPGSFNANWITALRNDDNEYTVGCDTNRFCPKEPVTREWFVFLMNP